MPSLPPAPPSPSLRLGTLNVGLGFLRKLPAILHRSVSLSLHVVALQEIGDPALLNTSLADYNLVYAAGGSAHEAGVGLLLSHDLSPAVRTFKRSKTGRLVGAVLELSKSQQILLVSAYMPSGLDHRSPADESTLLAHRLYAELLRWAVGMHQVVVMGDLNETLTALDRSPRPAARVAAVSPISNLQQEGFTDVWRHLYPSAAIHPGFTHASDSIIRSTRSRIDYIWTRGVPAACILHSRVDTKLHKLSHHHLLLGELQLQGPPLPSIAPQLRLQLPNLRNLSDTQRESFQKLVELRMQAFDRAASGHAADSLSCLAEQLTTITKDAGYSTLPITAGAALRNKSVLHLQHQRGALSRLLHLSISLLRRGFQLELCPDWLKLFSHCSQQFDLQWSTHYRNELSWLQETKQLLRRTRALIRQQRHRMLQQRVHHDPFISNTAATIHRMLQSDALPSQIHSVVDGSGELTSNADDLKEVMAAHFESVFALPPIDACAAPPLSPAPSMLFDKPNIDPRWYAELMNDVSEAELLQLLKDVPLISAPGQDGVSSGMWKLAVQGSPTLRKHVLSLFSSCLRTGTFPVPWKSSVIVPLIKDAHKERTMSNIRPISLQSCLGKLLSKILAYRLSTILSRHPILNPSQRGFVLGGTTGKCIDELLDAWDWSRAGSNELYTLFYDIKQAYDSVQTDVLVRALRRIHLPPLFIDLIADSLTDLTSCVRTLYGHSRSFNVLRSVRQGDPLAPLLFAILLDPLHDGLHTNPFDGQQHGCKLSLSDRSIYIPSLGYADDTNALCNSLSDLHIQNDWVQYFMSFNRMQLNQLKCELVGRMADGSAVTAAAVAAHGITINGHSLSPVPQDQPIRYLGVHAQFNGSWRAQFQKAREMIMVFTRAVTKFAVPVGQAVHMFNVFLLPKLELSLHYAHGVGTSHWARQCDSLLVGCIKHAVKSPLKLSHTAVALTTGLRLPSWMEACVKISELFLRLNSADPRWGELGRVLMRTTCGSVVDASTSLPRTSRLARAAYLATHVLQWSLHLRDAHRPGHRHQHLFAVPAEATATMPLACSSSHPVTLTAGSSNVAHDIWSGWGCDAPAQTVEVYTDGSFASLSQTSAWSMVVADDWLTSNFGSVPSEEQLVTSAHLAGATMFGSHIECTTGVYPAELQAIARTMAALPLSFTLTIHTDSLSSILAINAFQQQCNERRRMRMAARPLLQLIDHLLHRRLDAGGTLSLQHVGAHSTDTDIHSVGNRMADFQANLARSRPDRSWPRTLRQLPLSACEPHMHVLREDGKPIINDIRQSAWSDRLQQAMERWSFKLGQGLLAGEGIVDLGRIALRHGSRSQQSAVIHVATNSIHYHWVDSVDGDGAPSSSLEQLWCDHCEDVMSMFHFATCRSPSVQRHHEQLRLDMVQLISTFDCTRDWLRNNSHRVQPFQRLIQLLFPPFISDPDCINQAEVQLHICRCLVGGFTTSEGSAATRVLGFTGERQQGHIFLQQLRLLSLQSVLDYYTLLKESV